MDSGSKICIDHCGFVNIIRKCVEEKCSQDERDTRIMDWLVESSKAIRCDFWKQYMVLDFDIFACVDEIIEKKLYSI